jgi:RluA family pseudouridine synthase
VKGKPHPIEILWQDEALLVVNKPAGLPCLVDGYKPEAPYLLGLLKKGFDPIWVVHRLDRFTSGVIIFARSAEAHQALNKQFEKRTVIKIYHALINGDPSWDRKTIKIRLRPNGDRMHRTVVDPRSGKSAITEIRILERFGRYSLVEARPKTGRTHQIRAHLAYKNHPITADILYGGGPGILLSTIKTDYQAKERGERPILNRLGLHACRLEILHPINGQTLNFEAPYPKDIRLSLKYLRRFCT